MQSKGVIRFFTIALAIVCVYQLSFSLITRSVESDAEAFANGNPSKYKSYIDSMSNVGVFNILVKDYTYQECKEREVNLGLDLKGGMNVTMEVSVADVVKAMSNYNQDPTFNKAIELAINAQKNSQKDFVTLFGEEFQKLDANGSLAAIFATKDLQEKINVNSTNTEVLNTIRAEAESAIDRSYNILRTRIDKFGVTQPNIQKLAAGRILIELPGVKEPDRVRKLLQGSAKLEFWETYNNEEIFPALNKVNDLLKGLDIDKAAAEAKAAKTFVDTTATDSTKTELAKAEVKATPSLAKSDTGSAAQAEKFKKENPLFTLLVPALVQNEQGQQSYRPGPVVGYVGAKDTARINTILSLPQIKSLLPNNLRLLWSVKAMNKESNAIELVAIKVNARDGRAPLEGDAIADARQDFGSINHSPEISMTMNSEGAKTWKRLTAENIGKSIAIVLDNQVYSFPTVQGEIAGGRSSITGNFTINEAKDLANILKAGKLPAPAKIIQEAIVGPSLGQEAISASIISFFIAIVIILLFMGFYYNRAGWIANVALLVNMFFIMGVLTSIGAVLTLPGIAGIILTIGLSVDTNILIFERIREELHSGSGMKTAIKEGFRHAMSSILDVNITLFILGVILYIFGKGPIQGFATTLIIGILTSLITAILITRLMLENLLDKNKTIKFWSAATENVYKNISFNFVKRRKVYYFISAAIILAGIVAITQRGLQLGVDFTGGRTYVVRFDKDLTTDNIRQPLATTFGIAPEVKTFGGDNQFKITTSYRIDEGGEQIDAEVENALNKGLGTLGTFKILSYEKVGSNISDDIKTGAVYAILVSCALMFVYIRIRFKKWQYGLGAVIALFHDVLVVLAFYALLHGIMPFSMEIDQHFIAAILTVMGYTMNETVVVFDRIREYLNKTGKEDLESDEKEKIINYALNSTLSRTINTSLTVFFVLLAIFVFGGEVIRGFIFALLIGRVIGTYSSLCISTPIVIDFDRKSKKKNEELVQA